MKRIAIILALTIVGTSCKKYEEGPFISFRSKKERVANTWKIDKAYENGQETTGSYDQYRLYMSKDGDASLTSIYSTSNFTAEFETDGTWMFVNNKENIQFDYQDDDADETYQILKLKENELWLREKGGEVELRLVPA